MNGFTVNGQSQHLPEALDTTLIDVLREHIGLTGTKLVCGSGVCGAPMRRRQGRGFALGSRPHGALSRPGNRRACGRRPADRG